MLDYIIIIPVGMAIATFASLVGIGGGLMWAPFLILVMKFNPVDAVMISLLIQVAGMGSATLTFIRKKMIYWKLALGILPFMIVGGVAGVVIGHYGVEGKAIQFGLGGISLTISLLFAFQVEKYDVSLISNREFKAPHWLKVPSVIFGTISGMFSIGVGDFIIPIFRGKFKIPMQNTVGTALFLNFTLASFSGFSHLLVNDGIRDKYLYVLFFGIIGVAIGGQIGPRLSSHIHEGRLKELFIFIMMIIGLHMIYQAL